MLIQSIPMTAGLIGFFVMFKTYGLLNNLFSLSIVGALSVIPINIWFATDYIRKIPRELEEAAQIDGASRLQLLIKVILPLATPLLVTMSLFAFIATWNEFIYAVVLITKSSLFTYPIALLALGTEAVSAPVGTYRWGFLAAGSFIGCLPILITFVLFRKYFIEGLTRGALKA
ncbi:MAG: carbohydrate ABC transporter permease, partial [Candidatus Bathyarchaeia archaeon]